MISGSFPSSLLLIYARNSPVNRALRTFLEFFALEQR